MLEAQALTESFVYPVAIKGLRLKLGHLMTSDQGCY